MIDYLKKQILNYLRHTPYLRKMVSILYWKSRSILSNKNHSMVNFIFVNPFDINYISGQYFDIYRNEGVSKSGDWDIVNKAVVNDIRYVGIVDRFVNKIDWLKTDYYKHNIENIKAGKIMWNCTSEADFLVRCQELDSLFDSIKKDGYKSCIDRNYPNNNDEITVNIGRDGKILFNDGMHRLAISRILGIQAIPVRVIARHEIWNNHIELIKSNLPGNQESYQSFEHPDIDQNVNIIHSCINRWECIEKNLLPNSKTFLDIGGNIGYFTKKLEKIGLIGDIVEHESNYLKILYNTKKIFNYSYNIIPEDIFTIDFTAKRYDVVLALSIFHHFIKTKVFYDKLVLLLKRLNMNSLLLETHDINETQMIDSYRNFDSEDFCKFIIDNSCLNRFKIIGHFPNNRKLFLIYK